MWHDPSNSTAWPTARSASAPHKRHPITECSGATIAARAGHGSPGACMISSPSPTTREGKGRRDPGEGRRAGAEASSSGLRVAPSPGALSSNGILRRSTRPRMHKHEREHRPRGSRPRPSVRSGMRFAGIDIAAETHTVAIVDEAGMVLVKPTPFAEDAEGYGRLRERLGTATDLVVVMEATGHYWKNLFATLAAQGIAVALINPLRTHRFAEEDLARTKTDAIDAVGLARFGAQKRPAVTRLPAPALDELRELVRLRDRLVQDFGDRVRQLHRLVDLGFPEFTRHVKGLDTELATAILADYPTAQAFQGVSVKRLARLCYDGRHHVGLELATTLITAAGRSVGRHHGEAYRI